MRGIAALFLLLLGPAGPSGRAAAQQGTEPGRVIEYTVREGDTCAAIARRYYGSARRYDLVHRLNPGLGPTPHHLRSGVVLRLPPSQVSGGPDAHLTAARRSVRSRAPRDDTWRPARIGQELSRGSQVVTDERSSAELTFRDTSVVQMREHTLVIIYGGSGRSARRSSSATLERGVLRSRLDELAGRLAVRTPSSEARVGRGEAIVTVATDGTSRVVNLGGRPATVTAGEVAVSVPAGTGTVVRRGGTPAPPRPLPQPPRWANDLAGRFVGLTGRGGTLRGGWIAVEGAARYRVEAARRPDGGDVVAAVEVPGDVTRFEIHGIPRGTYYLSVSTIDREAFEGRPSPRRAMQMMEVRMIQPGGGEPFEQPFDPGDPSRPWRPPAVLLGTWIVAPVGMRCAFGDFEPRNMATVRVAGRRRVRCVDSRDRDIPAFVVESVGARAELAEPGQALLRGGEQTVEIRLTASLDLPSRIVPRVPEGVAVTRVVRRRDRLLLSLRAAADAPAEIRLDLGVLAATEHIALATVRLPVRDPPGLAEREGPPPPSPARPSPVAVADAFAALPLPGVLPLDDPSHRGVRSFVALGALGVGGATRLRSTAGVRAQVFDEPMRVGFSWSLDPRGADAGDRPGGDADLLASAAWVLAPAERLTLTVEASAWIPTGASDAGLDGARLAPSLHLTYHLGSLLSLRTRQGALVDPQEAGARLWASAWGLTLRPHGALAIGLELDASLGARDRETLAAFAVGLSTGLRLRAVELSAGLRVGLGADGPPIMGRWAGVLALRIAFGDM